MNQRLTLAFLTIPLLLLPGLAPAAGSRTSDVRQIPQGNVPGLKKLARTASLPAILVTNTNDSGPGSLRQALLDANSHVGPDSIAFNIPKADPGYTGPSSVWKIKPLSQLPILTDDGTIIEGESQRGFFPGANPYGPAIELDGSSAGSPVAGLAITCSYTWVHRLAINRFSDMGIIIAGPTHSYNFIYQCFIGVTPDGLGKAPNLKSGVQILDAQHNFVAMGDTGTINVIGANGDAGIEIIGSGSQFNYVGYNCIGTDLSHTIDLGNTGDGIRIKNGATDNAVGLFFFPPDVVVWNNHQAGIRVSGATTVRNLIGAGSVTRNGNYGIILEFDANNFMPSPMILQVTANQIDAHASPNSFVGFFRDSDNEGEELLGIGFADASGNVTYSGPVRGPYITAVAIDTTSGPTKYNTSAFSPPYPFQTRIEVTNTLDSGPGSLREAIDQANIKLGSDSITFAIPTSDQGYNSLLGTWTIKPQTPLPEVLDRETIIDGFTQNEFLGYDANPLGPEIEVEGSLLDSVAGFTVGPQLVGAVIQGLVINRFGMAGIHIQYANSISVIGCYIGTDARGVQSAPNYTGVLITGRSRGCWVGRTQSLPGNLISGNRRCGIQITDSSSGTFIRGNTIGLDRTKTQKLGNSHVGILLDQGSGNAEIFGNAIGANWMAVYIEGGSHNCIIEQNTIGTDTSCRVDLGNASQGVYVLESQGTDITGNCIAYNGASGVIIYGTSGLYNRVSRNRICHHSSPGIWSYGGGNTEYARPSITGLSGWVLSGKSQAYDSVEVFADSVDEGEFFLGATHADPGGNWSFTLADPPVRRFLTATARDANGNTSGFSAPFDYVTAGVEGGQAKVPRTFALEQNYPNPFNPKTVVSSQLPVVSNVRIVIYDLLGREVKVLVGERRTAGYYEDTFDGSGLASSVYVYRMTAGAFVQTRKMILIK